ncbi:putative nuclease HARBI1 [Aphis craccivora]|uniref:Putative nuclease HARBI1 n=1 Tax=Aphis craccivora TaxID=307492 RepID=A0A6G0Y5Z2_APHCR|nr:putative nuclease HARBI1 [Aphis craccivora]
MRRNPDFGLPAARSLAGQSIIWVTGDSGYPLRPWLMTPLTQYQPNTPEERYNHRFKYVRSLIERCLLKHRILHYSLVKAYDEIEEVEEVDLEMFEAIDNEIRNRQGINEVISW